MPCTEKDTCIAYDPEAPECQKDNGCMTEKNIRNYLEWCRNGLEASK